MISLPQIRGPLVAVILLPCMAVIASAQNDRNERIGYTQLVDWLGATPVPTGAGVPVAQVEGSTTSSPVTYLPMGGTGTFAGAGTFFSTKTFTAESGGSGNGSGHAGDVGGFFFGNLTDPNIDVNDRSSVAPGVTTISCFEAGSYIISGGVSTAGSKNKKVHSHAWVSYTNAGIPALTPAAVNGYLRTLDREAGVNNFIPVVGVNNGSGSAIPELVSSAYNVISVGNSNGNHSSGTTLATVDGPGRIKPEIVASLGAGAPLNATSYATGVVSGVVALLCGVANDAPALSNAYDEAEAMRAILLAGATKEEFPTWSRTLASPLDAKYGAGEVNVHESYRILTAGEQAAGGAAGLRGWDFGAVPSGSPPQEYTITVPNEFYADVSIAVTWNRFKDGMGPMAPYVVHNLNLRLVDPSPGTVEWDRSDSAIDNVEHIYYRNLPPGQYVIELTRTADPTKTTEYGLAWRMDLTEGPLMEAEATVLGPDVSLSFEDLDPAVEYTIERSPGDLVTWAPIHVFTPTTPTNAGMPYVDINAKAIGDKVHYRLVWEYLTNQ